MKWVLAVSLLLCFFVAYVHADTVTDPIIDMSTPPCSYGDNNPGTPACVNQVDGQHGFTFSTVGGFEQYTWSNTTGQTLDSVVMTFDNTQAGLQDPIKDIRCQTGNFGGTGGMSCSVSQEGDSTIWDLTFQVAGCEFGCGIPDADQVTVSLGYVAGLEWVPGIQFRGYLDNNRVSDTNLVTLTDIAAPVPEPASLALLGTGLVGFFVRRKFKR